MSLLARFGSLVLPLERLEREPKGMTFHRHQETTTPVWKPRPASELLKIPLSRRRIFETEDGSQHFVGVDMLDSSGRVSSPIVTFDPVTLQGTTQTMRIYELVGRNGCVMTPPSTGERHQHTSSSRPKERLHAKFDRTPCGQRLYVVAQ